MAANLNYENESLIFILMPYNISAGASGDELEFRIKFDWAGTFVNVKEIFIFLALNDWVYFVVKEWSTEND